MASKLYKLLGNCGMKGKNLQKRRRLIDFAWQNCEHKNPYTLDQLLTHGGVFTQIRILVIVAMFGYEEATKLYPVLKEGQVAPPDRSIPMIGDEDEIEDISSDWAGLEGIIDSVGVDKSILIEDSEIEEEAGE